MKKLMPRLLFIMLLLLSICLTGCQKPASFLSSAEPAPSSASAPISGAASSKDAVRRVGQPPEDTLVPTQFHFFSPSYAEGSSLLIFPLDEDAPPDILSAPYYAAYLRFDSIDGFLAYADDANVTLSPQTLETLESYPTPGQVLLLNLTWTNGDYYTLSSEVREETLDMVLHFHTYEFTEPPDDVLEYTRAFLFVIDKGFGDRYSLKVQ